MCCSFNIGFVSRWPRWAAPLSSLPSCNFGSFPLCCVRFQAFSWLCHPAATIKGCRSLYCKVKLLCFVFAKSDKWWEITMDSVEDTSGPFILTETYTWLWRFRLHRLFVANLHRHAPSTPVDMFSFYTVIDMKQNRIVLLICSRYRSCSTVQT